MARNHFAATATIALIALLIPVGCEVESKIPKSEQDFPSAKPAPSLADAAAIEAAENERHQQDWENSYWSFIDNGETDEQAAVFASLGLDAERRNYRRSEFEAKTPEQKAVSREKYNQLKKEQSRAAGLAAANQERWEREYNQFLSYGYSHDRAAESATRSTGDRDSRWRYEAKMDELENKVRAKDRERWYQLFLRDGYTPEEAAYKANKIVH
jgi:hypothetical protein